MSILSIGEALWDVFLDRECLGGAALNFAAHAKILGHSVFFISAVGDDDRGCRALETLKAMGLCTRFVHQVQGWPTGAVTVSLNPAGTPNFIIHRPAAYDFPELSDSDLSELASYRPEWIYFGTLFQMRPTARDLTVKLLEYFPRARRFYDINLRKDNYTAELINELLPLANVVKLNDQEADAMQTMFGWSYESLEDFCKGTAARFGWEAVCVTRGEAGCVLLVGGSYVEGKGYKVKVADTVGAGDAVAAAIIHGLEHKWSASEIADFANRVGAVVSSCFGGTPAWSILQAEDLI